LKLVLRTTGIPPQDALDGSSRQPATIALHPGEALFGDRRHDDAVAEERGGGVV
jgi:hypothetical protein